MGGEQRSFSRRELQNCATNFAIIGGDAISAVTPVEVTAISRPPQKQVSRQLGFVESVCSWIPMKSMLDSLRTGATGKIGSSGKVAMSQIETFVSFREPK
jgi:hypothetical protein